jgi:hypothetical protein
MVTRAHEAQQADLARMVAAYELSQREIVRLRQDRDALVTCVILLIGVLDRAGLGGPEVEQARRVAGNCPPVELARPGDLPAPVLARAFIDAFGRRRACYICSGCGTEHSPHDGRTPAGVAGSPHANCPRGGVWQEVGHAAP